MSSAETPAPIAHVAAQLCRCAAQRAFDHLSTPQGMARWCLGMFQTRAVGDGLVTGISLFSGATVFARLDCDPVRLRIVYRVGATPQALTPWIQAQAVAGAELGYPRDQCLVSMTAFRPQSMSQDNWLRVMRTHETELDLMRAQLESSAGA